MKTLVLSLFLTSFLFLCVQADSDTSQEKAVIDKNEFQKQIKAQIQREKKYAKERMFYHGKEYNLSDAEVDPSVLDSVPLIEPEYDFDMTDVYRDDI